MAIAGQRYWGWSRPNQLRSSLRSPNRRKRLDWNAGLASSFRDQRFCPWRPRLPGQNASSWEQA